MAAAPRSWISSEASEPARGVNHSLTMLADVSAKQESAHDRPIVRDIIDIRRRHQTDGQPETGCEHGNVELFERPEPGGNHRRDQTQNRLYRGPTYEANQASTLTGQTKAALSDAVNNTINVAKTVLLIK